MVAYMKVVKKDGQREWLLKKKRESGHKLMSDTISTITKTNEFMQKFIDRTARYKKTYWSTAYDNICSTVNEARQLLVEGSILFGY